eukprot:12544154-Ditylum_brightwellii.AAC.1
MFLLHSDRKGYGSLVADLANAHTRGKDKYPTTMTDAYKYLVNFQAPTMIHNTPDKGGMAFYTDGSGQGQGGGQGQGSGHGHGGGRGRNDGHGSAGRGRGQGNPNGGSRSGQPIQDKANLTEVDDRNDDVDDNSTISESSNYSCYYSYHQTVVYFQQNNLSANSIAMDSASSVNI